MNNDVIRQPNDIMVCSFSPSVFVKKVKYLYSAAPGNVEQTVNSIAPYDNFTKWNQQAAFYLLGSMQYKSISKKFNTYISSDNV